MISGAKNGDGVLAEQAEQTTRKNGKETKNCMH